MTFFKRKMILTFTLLMGLNVLTPVSAHAVGIGDNIDINNSIEVYEFISYDNDEKEALIQKEKVTDVNQVINIYDKLLVLLNDNKDEYKDAVIKHEQELQELREKQQKRYKIEAVIDTCFQQLGKDYVWGAEGPDTFDCSGLMLWTFNKHGYKLPRVAADQALTGEKLTYEELERGDMVFFHTDKLDPKRISHVGLYLGDGFFVHAPQTGDVVKISYMARGKYFNKFAWGVRVI